MIKKIFRYWHGYLRIEIRGNALSRFINQMTDIGIVIWDLKRIQDNYYLAKIYKNDFIKLRDLLRVRKCTVKILEKKGLTFYVWKIKKRYFLLIGIIFFLFLFYLASSFLLSINIVGLNRLEERDILNILSQEGIKRNILKENLNTEKIEGLLIRSFPEIAWVNVSWKGTKLNIEIVEKKIIKTNKSSEVLAAKDGIIHEMIVLKGVPVVAEGDTVREGQILIINPNQEQEARGIVTANVWYEAKAVVDLYNKEVLKTTQSKTYYGLRIFNKSFYPYRNRQPYKNYYRQETVKKILKWRNISLPIELIKEEHQEIVLLKENRSEQLARHLAKEKVVTEILKGFDQETSIISIDFEEIEDPEQELIKIRCIIMVEENIAVMQK